MKITKLCLILAFTGFMLSSCTSTNPRGFSNPPAKHKKAPRGKSPRGF